MALLIAAVVALALLAGGAAAAWYLLNRANRINPRVRGVAPLSWLWRPDACARYHRRLRKAMRGARGAVAQGRVGGLVVDGLAEAIDELERHALRVDEQLVVAARFRGPVRRSMLRGLRPTVAEIEVLAARMAASVVARSSFSPDGLHDVVQRLTDRMNALDAAHAEIARLEATFQGPALGAPIPIGERRPETGWPEARRSEAGRSETDSRWESAPQSVPRRPEVG
jgi:hypothetical protein